MIARYLKPLLSICLLFTTFTVFGAYVKISDQIRNSADVQQLMLKDPNKIQVLYFFSYGCAACARFDPYFDKWQKIQKNNSKLVVYKFPVSFEEEWIQLAKMYFIAKILDPMVDLDEKIFTAIHDQRLELWQKPLMQQFFVQNGYSAESFAKAYKSFSVNTEVKQVEELSAVYHITQTPTIVINGFTASYKLNKGESDINAFFKTIDNLIVKESNNK